MTLYQRTIRRLASAILATLLGGSNAHSQDLVDSALRFFVGNDSNTAGFDLDKARPQPVPPDFRTRVLNSLPTEGRVTKLKEPQRQKLDALGTVLRLHQRQSVYEFAVFESAPKPFAFIGLHQRAVLLISDVALNLLDAAELQASVAHEIGHEYVWAEYLEADRRNDNRRLKELELMCDGVAILTSRRVGVDPASLLTGIEKIAKFNALSTGPTEKVYRYPSAEERRRLAQALITWADSDRRRRCVPRASGLVSFNALAVDVAIGCSGWIVGHSEKDPEVSTGKSASRLESALPAPNKNPGAMGVSQD